MEDFQEKTTEELLRAKRNKPMSDAITREIDIELQGKQQKTNTKQISILIKEIKRLKNITEQNAIVSTQNARSSNRLAKLAIVIAVASLIAQVIFSTHKESRCASISISTSDPNFWHHSGCYWSFDMGLLGTYYFSRSDYISPAL